MHEQDIYYGAPGTGKSFLIMKKLHKSGIKDSKIFRVTIHPEFTYSDFVGQLLPEKTSKGDITFNFNPGPFTDALMEAYADTSKNVYLILEELSRGNAAAIFGDLFQLLDRDEHFVSRYPIRNKNIANMIPVIVDDSIILPANLNIIGTVNLNDQGVFPMDTAFKRRFNWIYIPTKPVKLDNGDVDLNLNNPEISIPISNDRDEDIKTNWLSLYSAINLFVTDKKNGLGKKEDKQVGQFFIDFGELGKQSRDPSNQQDAKKKIDSLIVNKLLMYLWQDVQDDGSLLESNGLFDSSIYTFENIVDRYGNEKVFSDRFISKYLLPSKDKY